MNSFINSLEEIEKLRISGFIRPALFESLSLIDRCAKVTYNISNNYERYTKWVIEYIYYDYLAYAYGFISVNMWLTCEDHIEINKIVQDTAKNFADEIYTLRCNLLHEFDIDIKSDKKIRYVNINRLYKITPMSDCKYGVAVFKSNEPYNYNPVDIGFLINQIYYKIKEFYENASDDIRNKLNDMNNYFIDETKDDWFEDFSKLWTIEVLNNRRLRKGNK